MSWNPDNPRYCQNCRKALKVCVCESLSPQLSLPLATIILRSEAEVKRSRGTVWPLGKLFPQMEIKDGPDFSSFRIQEGDVLLFPASTEDVVYDSKSHAPQRLVIPDGTWKEASRMVREIPQLAKLPRLRLPQELKGAYTLRRAIEPGKISTLEAFREALASLNLLSTEQKSRLNKLLQTLNQTEYK